MNPYRRLNLTRNPFGELTRPERAELGICSVETWLGLINGPNADKQVVQFIGECGRGKSTHLLSIHAQVPGARYVYLPIDQPAPTLDSHRPLLVDEAQRLTKRARRKLFADGGPLVLGTHEDLTSEIAAAGLSVTTVPVASLLTAERLQAILHARIAASRLGPGSLPHISLNRCQRLIETFGDDIRSMEHHLYLIFTKIAVHGQLSAYGTIGDGSRTAMTASAGQPVADR